MTPVSYNDIHNKKLVAMKEVCYVGAQRQLAGEAREDGRVYVWHVSCEHGKMIFLRPPLPSYIAPS